MTFENQLATRPRAQFDLVLTFDIRRPRAQTIHDVIQFMSHKTHRQGAADNSAKLARRSVGAGDVEGIAQGFGGMYVAIVGTSDPLRR